MNAVGYIVLTTLCMGFATAQEHARTIHVFVALCDNEHQGIVPVPKELGKGDDPAHNLYWGALYGVKTFFSKSRDWTLVTTQKNPSGEILERVVFRHKCAIHRHRFNFLSCKSCE